MKPPGQLGGGERKIPIAETSRRNMGGTLGYHLTRIRKIEGVDPERYPPVASDIEYDTQRTMIGAEITARETADLILPAIRSAESLSTPNTGRGTRIFHSLIVILGIATTSLAWMTYQETLVTNNQINTRRSKAEHLGRALLANPKMVIELKGTEFSIDYKPSLEESVGDVIHVPHKIPPEELERLNQK